MNSKTLKINFDRKFFLLFLIPLFLFSIEINAQNNCTEIFQLIQKKDSKAIKALIENDADVVFCTNNLKSTPLIVAASANELDLVKIFLKHNANVNAANNSGTTAIFFAALNGNKEMVDLLKQAGADLKHKSNAGRYPVHYAASSGNLELFKSLLKNSDINILDDSKASLLHWAAYGGNVEIFKYMQEKGLDPKYKDADHNTVLHWSASKGSPEMFDYLVNELKFDIYEHDGFYNYPISSALESKNIEAVNFFLEKGFDPNTKLAQGQSVLQLACYSGDAELVKKIINHGVNVNAADDGGGTAINWAAMSGNTEIIDILLNQGANINPKYCTETMCSDAHSPLHSAAWRSPAMLKYLINKGANVNIANEFGQTPLFNAIQSDSIRAVKVLCEAGTIVDFADKYGYTALHNCAIIGSLEQAKLLLEYKADVNLKDKQGKTALHYAAINGNADMAKLLIDAGAKIDEKDNKEHSPYFYAVYYGNDKMKETLADAKESMTKELKTKSNLLKQELADGEAFVWYLNHSGYAVKTKNNLLIFDYWSRDAHPDLTSINNGNINPDEIKDLNVTVFASHSHRDHYSAEILEWKDKIKNINYVIGFEPVIDVDYTYIPFKETKKVGDVEITAIKSNDGGEAFAVQVDGVKIYHAGDHSNIITELSPDFAADMDFIAEKYGSIDLVFLPVTGCRFQNKEGLKNGNIASIKKLNPKKVFPMHGSNREWSYNEFVLEMQDYFNEDIFFVPWNRGDRVFISNKDLTSSK